LPIITFINSNFLSALGNYLEFAGTFVTVILCMHFDKCPFVQASVWLMALSCICVQCQVKSESGLSCY
jgi:hypothetical protein